MQCDNVQCPTCNGTGRILGVMPVYGPGHRGERKPVIDMQCNRCNGSGEIPEVQLEWIRRGRAMRDDRLKRRVTLRAESRRRGMLPSEPSAIEQGRVDPLET